MAELARLLHNKNGGVMDRFDAGLDDARFATLTPRERDVMHHVVTGKPNKIIAAELGVSQRTIEAHRARVFRKLRVRNAVELAHCLASRRRA